MISREIKNFRRFDGNPDSLLKLFSACRHEKRAVDFSAALLGWFIKFCCVLLNKWELFYFLLSMECKKKPPS